VTTAHTRDFRSDIVELVEGIVSTLPPGTAVISVERSTTEVAARVEPANPAAAPITVHAEVDVPVIDVVLGKGGFFEVSTNRARYSDLEEPLDEVRALCLAAIRGDYKETVRFKGAEVVSSTAVVLIGSREEPLHWRQLFTNPLKRTRRCKFDYEPYVAD
jgi:hypothetical protein